VTVPLAEDHPTEKRVEVVETILVDADDDYDDNDDQPEDTEVQEERVEGEQQHQPVG
jgi:hypothetical protein